MSTVDVTVVCRKHELLHKAVNHLIMRTFFCLYSFDMTLHITEFRFLMPDYVTLGLIPSVLFVQHTV